MRIHFGKINPAGFCLLILLLAVVRIHFRMSTTNVAYRLGQMKERENQLLEQRASLSAQLAKMTSRKNLESLAGKTSTHQ